MLCGYNFYIRKYEFFDVGESSLVVKVAMIFASAEIEKFDKRIIVGSVIVREFE